MNALLRQIRPASGPGNAPDGSLEWQAWEARLDAGRAAVQGPPDPAQVALARQLAVQELALFGTVRTLALRPYAPGHPERSTMP